MATRLTTLPQREADFIEPIDCGPVPRLPDGSRWVFEIKLDDFKKTETAALANKSGVPDFQPPLLPAAAVTVTLTEEPVRYLAALLDREENSIAADLRAMLAATATTSRLVPRNKRRRS
jgi:hypothetical protein